MTSNQLTQADLARRLAGPERSGVELSTWRSKVSRLLEEAQPVTLAFALELAGALGEKPLRFLAEVLDDPERVAMLTRDARARFDARMRAVIGELQDKELATVQGDQARKLFALVGYLGREGLVDEVEKAVWLVRALAVRHALGKMSEFFSQLPTKSKSAAIDAFLFHAFEEGETSVTADEILQLIQGKGDGDT